MSSIAQSPILQEDAYADGGSSPPTLEDRKSSRDLSNCPQELQALDPNAALLWSIFLRKAGLSMASDGRAVLEGDGTPETETKRAWTIRNLGIPSLLQRLAGHTTEIQRARIWWRESIACSEGESEIPDLANKNLYWLNPFIVTPELKFPDPRSGSLARARAERELGAAEQVRKRGRPRKTAGEKRETAALRVRKHRAGKRANVTL